MLWGISRVVTGLKDANELAVLTLSDHRFVRTPHKDQPSLGYNLSGSRESRLLFALNPQLSDVNFRFRLFTTTGNQSWNKKKEK